MALGGSDDLNVLAIGEAALSRKESLEQRVAALYGTHRDAIYRFLVGQGVEPAFAQEATQNVFVDLFLALRKESDIRSEQSWLYTVAARAAVDYWRRERRPIWVELDASPLVAENFRSREPSPEAQTIENQRLQRIAESMRRLPKEQRLCVHLRMQGLRYREIAEVLGVSTSTAADWLATAVERLRGAAHD
jgi:RNA polymerase sigma-70 factor (ECF subfamily)